MIETKKITDFNKHGLTEVSTVSIISTDIEKCGWFLLYIVGGVRRCSGNIYVLNPVTAG